MGNKVKEILCWAPASAIRDIGDYSKKERNFFLLGMFGQNIIYSVVGSVMQVFYTDILIVPAIVVSVIMGVSRLWDGANDLIMGTIVDKTHTRWGKCRPYLKFLPIPIAISTILLFMPIGNTPLAFKIVYIIFSFLLWETLYTLADIPLWGMTSLMTADEKKRSELISASRIVCSLAAIVVVAFYPLKDLFGALDVGFFENTGKVNSDLRYFSEPQGYLFAVALVAIVGGVLFRIPFSHVRERIKQAPKDKDTNFIENLKLMWENKHYVRIILASILGCTKAIILNAGIYFCKWVLGNGGDESLYLVILGGPFLLGLLISMNRSTWFAKKFTKKKMYLMSSYLNAVPYILLFIVGYDSLFFAALMLAAGGFLSGFTTVYNTTMIADSVDYMEWKKGKRNDGVFFSGMNFIAKLTAAITAVIINVAFHLVDYTNTIDGLTTSIAKAAALGQNFSLDFASAYPRITMAMFILITLIPALGSILQALPIHGYKLTEDVHSKILDELAERRAKSESKEYAR